MLSNRFDARGARFRARPKRAPRTPNNAYRRVHSVHAPKAVEAALILAMQRVASRFEAIVRPMVMPRVADFAMDEERKDATSTRFDAKKKHSAQALVAKMKKAVEGTTTGLDVDLDKVADRTYQHSKKEFKRLAIDVRKEPTMTPLIAGWRRDSVNLITNMQRSQLDKIEKILDEGYGHRGSTIAAQIENQLGVSHSRAKLIGRDQVLSLHSKITRYRQMAAGIRKYVWTTVQDERVRPEHEELEGQVFSWDGEGDPDEGHPGEAINCRCTAYPKVGWLEDDDDDE